MFKEIRKLMFSKYCKWNLVFLTRVQMILTQRIFVLERTKEMMHSSPLLERKKLSPVGLSEFIDSTQIVCNQVQSETSSGGFHFKYFTSYKNLNVPGI